ncbi:MAG: hypothetical protein CMP49_01515 [Flavobacteriales bacterium]|nr:hypothetical protein [Flavobacteriales bacterium]|tara:strand:- start:268 stop:780 length:513 start_codon:yes stop_codon:yes gene_type:complete
MFQIGHICKCYGLDGHFSIKLAFPVHICREFQNLKTIYLEKEDFPLKIIHSILNNSIYLKTRVESIKSREEAKSILQKNVFIKYGDHKEIDALIKKLNKFLKFKIIDSHLGEIGEVTNIDYNRPQTLLSIQSKNKEILIPFVDDLISKIDEKNKLIYTQLPEGLIDICCE